MRITKRQITAFGLITHDYANAESGLKILLSDVLGIDLLELLILTEPHSAFGLRNAAKALLKGRLAGKELERYINIIGELGAIGPLRNQIAHSRWTKGKRRGSIKPFGVDIREGRPETFGKGDQEKDWTSAELEAQANKLFQINGHIVQLLREHEAMASKTP